MRWLALLLLLSGAAHAQVGQVPMAVFPPAALTPTGPLALDSQVFTMVSSSVTSQALPGITTAFARDTLIALVSVNGTTVSSVTDTAGLTWQRRATSGGANPIEEWFTVTTAALTSDVVTVHYAASTSFSVLDVFAVSGTHTAAPFDTNVSLPATVSSGAVVVSTTAANTFLFDGYRTLSSGGVTTTGFNVLLDQSVSSGLFFASGYLVETTPQSGLSIPPGSGVANNGGIGDALK